MLVLGNPLLQVIGVSHVEAAIRTVEHVGPEPHAAHRAERKGLQRVPMKVVLSWVRHKLSPNSLVRQRQVGQQSSS